MNESNQLEWNMNANPYHRHPGMPVPGNRAKGWFYQIRISANHRLPMARIQKIK